MMVTSRGALPPALEASTLKVAGALALTPLLSRPGPLAFTLLASMLSQTVGLNGLPVLCLENRKAFKGNGSLEE